ncbi:MAG: class I SAM-dependent methyltransferase [Deltaproteobacteria bacterium]|nr:MAG: class I SAM-dependent methyltransferase [Deltaproteobacteria bacterium]
MSDYYQNHFQTYHQKTFTIDPSSFLEPLRKHLEPGCTILDIGCGSGRDMLWLKNNSFTVSGFERSAGLADLARQNTGSDVIKGDFEAFDFTTRPIDAILLAGSLVHVPHENLPHIFERVTAGLRPGGKVLITLKQGQGTGTDELGRFFYYWQSNDLEALFKKFGFTVLEFNRQVSKVNDKDVWLGFVLEKNIFKRIRRPR